MCPARRPPRRRTPATRTTTRTRPRPRSASCSRGPGSWRRSRARATPTGSRLARRSPVKFLVRDALGQVVQQRGSPTFSRSANLGSCGVPHGGRHRPCGDAGHRLAVRVERQRVPPQLEHEGPVRGRLPAVRRPGRRHPAVRGRLPLQVALSPQRATRPAPSGAGLAISADNRRVTPELKATLANLPDRPACT